MRIYIAHNEDTLRTIAQKFTISVDDLLACNPTIEHPDLNVAGRQVRFPSSSLQQAIPSCDVTDILNPGEYLDHWIPLTPIEEMAQKDYDVIIVGTGAGGSAVLWRLCEQWQKSGKRIAVVEAGDLFLPTHAQNIPTLNGNRRDRFFRNRKFWKPVPTANANIMGDLSLLPSAPHYFEEFIALGGRGMIWGNAVPEMHPVDIAKWPVSLKEMTRYYTIAKQVMNVSSDYGKDSSLTEVILNRLVNNGFPEAVPLPLAVDLQPTKYGYIHSNVFFSSMDFFAWALSFGSFDLAVKARAIKVRTEKNKAVGVEVMTRDKKTYHLRGKTVVLSTSTFETPRILLSSGIPGKAIGHYLTTHSRIDSQAAFETTDFPEILGTADVLVPRTAERDYQIQIGYSHYLYELKPIRNNVLVWFGASGLVESRYENYVALNRENIDEYGVPRLEVHFSYSVKDEKLLHKMTEGVKQAAGAAQGVITSLCSLPPGLVYHEMGTCRMGTDPETSVTNPYGRVHGVQGLYIADNSVIPTSGAANPTLTTIALAIRTADYLMKQFQ
ncbi:GMC oxidoreductase [Bacillus taeanensis]|nr:GMC oxidoreductase [Bacillus taeanensis]